MYTGFDIAIVVGVLAAFGYGLYVVIKRSKAKKANNVPGGGGGRNPGDPPIREK